MKRAIQNTNTRAERLAKQGFARARMARQGIVDSAWDQPAQVVASLGAVQAQDYFGSLWAVGLRLAPSTDGGDSAAARIDRAIAERRIVRTWPMRGTLHWVAAPDVHWMLGLLTPRVVSGMSGRHLQMGLDAATFARSEKILGKELSGGRVLSRPEVYRVLQRGKIETDGQRGIHLLGAAAQRGLICFGPRIERQPSFVLLDEWIPAGLRRGPSERDEALAELAIRYFTGHGPAALHDLVWWSGLKVADAKRGIEAAGESLTRIEADGVPYWVPKAHAEGLEPGGGRSGATSAALLPPFDEFLVGYRDRSAAVAAEHQMLLNPGANGMLRATFVRDGRVLGTWRRRPESGKKAARISVHLQLEPFVRLSKLDERAWRSAAGAYGRFLGARRASSEILAAG